MTNEKIVCFLEKTRTSTIEELARLTFSEVAVITIDQAGLGAPNLAIEQFIKDIPNDKPIVYFFQIKERGGLSNTDIAEIFEKVKGTQEGFSAVNIKKIKSDSSCLYVGKVRKKFVERLNLHLGFAKYGDTQGMRLKEWLPKCITLELSYCSLDLPEYPFLVDLFEEHLKKELKSIIGIK